jgi:hypothetical protein
MSTDGARYRFQKLLRKTRMLRVLETVLLSIAISIIAISVLKIWLPATVSVGTGSMCGLVFFIYKTIKKKTWNYPAEILIVNLHNRFPAFEESLDLIAFDHQSLTQIQQLQREKIQQKFLSTRTAITIQSDWKRNLILLVGAFGLFYILSLIPGQALLRSDQRSSKLNSSQKILTNALPPSIKSITIDVQPPGYTQKPNYRSENPNLIILEGSTIHWSVTFSDSVRDAGILLAGQKNKIRSNRAANQVTAKSTISASTFYQIRWTNEAGITKSSDYFKIETIPDRYPIVSVTNLDQSIDLSINDNLAIDLKAQMSDDYGLSDGYIIATVTKGSGESVKFREEKLSFTTPRQIAGKSVHANRTMDLLKLGMEPGDELYLYVEVLDNKTPTANKARTETFFITLRDTASQSLSIEGGLGVDLMPDYFRSQRQIIIDTEKLLKEKAKLTKSQFSSTSNELGYDQKVLRLKYGEFLGEEFETRIGEATPDEGEESADDIAKKYTHVHDTENEHNLVKEKKDEPEHKHEDDGNKTESLADAYKHQHDNAEEATFFNQSIRSKLKAALTEMWDAELYLRLYQPEKSLPFQYKVLKLLKEISNDSRIYVHRTGFDPPPIKEEKRLTGDLAEIRTTREKQNNQENEIYPAIRAGLELIQNKLSNNHYQMSNSDKIILHNAGIELARRALERPGNFLNALTLLKSLDEDNLSKQKVKSSLVEIQKAFWLAIPNGKTTPNTRATFTHAVDKIFLKNLDALSND